ncbi:MAG: SemiSWEET family transporter [Ferruginibacter sp.]|jgi:MtN3 and saliva related transmembrane protein
MNIPVADYVGYAGGFVSAITFLPQVIKIWKTKSVKDLSSLTLLLLFVNVSLWLVYGILVNASPIMATNGIVLSMIIAMIYFKWKFK